MNVAHILYHTYKTGLMKIDIKYDFVSFKIGIR